MKYGITKRVVSALRQTAKPPNRQTNIIISSSFPLYKLSKKFPLYELAVLPSLYFFDLLFPVALLLVEVAPSIFCWPFIDD
jgi:hypothetical protein